MTITTNICNTSKTWTININAQQTHHEINNQQYHQ
jgi:hypothetical protein